MSVLPVAERFCCDVRACFPPVPDAVEQGRALFSVQPFERKLSIAISARAVLRTCAAHAFERDRMRKYFRPEFLHFQHLYCIDDLLRLLPSAGTGVDDSLPTAGAPREKLVLWLQVALAQCEASQDWAFGFSRPDPSAPCGR